MPSFAFLNKIRFSEWVLSFLLCMMIFLFVWNHTLMQDIIETQKITIRTQQSYIENKKTDSLLRTNLYQQQDEYIQDLQDEILALREANASYKHKAERIERAHNVVYTAYKKENQKTWWTKLWEQPW